MLVYCLAPRAVSGVWRHHRQRVDTGFAFLSITLICLVPTPCTFLHFALSPASYRCINTLPLLVPEHMSRIHHGEWGVFAVPTVTHKDTTQPDGGRLIRWTDGQLSFEPQSSTCRKDPIHLLRLALALCCGRHVYGTLRHRVGGGQRAKSRKLLRKRPKLYHRESGQCERGE